MTDQQSNRPIAPENGEPKGPGGQLREARRSFNLSIEQVAAYLRLHPATVRNLEEDNYAHLPAPTFVRGYLRAYARSLDLDPEPILHSFRKHHAARPAPIQGIVDHPRIRGNHIVVRVSTYLIVFALIVLLFSWWQEQISFGDGIAEEKILVLPEEMNAGIPPAGETQTAPPRFTASEKNRKPDAQDNRSDSPETEVVGVTEALPQSGEAPRPNPNESISPVSTGNTSVTAALPEETGEPATKPPEETTPAPPNAPKIGSLTLHLRGDSWMEIYDGNGKRLYYRTGVAGKTYKFQGITPFQVTLGYARGVDVVYNGKPFDLTPYIQRELAEFSLD